MLRSLLGEPPRQNEGIFANAVNIMDEMAQLMRQEIERAQDPSHDFRKIEIWTGGLISSLNELEESLFAAAFFREKVTAGYPSDMSGGEKNDYARYVYFYKNGFIRVFSILDKLGTVLNELFDLQTSKVKEHFSYFTVLRQLREIQKHSVLALDLTEIKEHYKHSVGQLRKRRNTEIHYMNAEMQDDLWQRHQALHEKVKLEHLDQHLFELREGLDMVCRSLYAAFSYVNRQWKK
ncbi:Cthe-2314 family HEPN domain-containing protein [Paenibacillus sediminis]|uniref:Cthe-2314-like HEPN domain-containing protein n=1 Tax=Paenibacillus sediminis TaxID=664909 RepID=A0ABS4H5X6_9BACL|nr:hypothetical protein [Paenibacillus sediminis]